MKLSHSLLFSLGTALAALLVCIALGGCASMGSPDSEVFVAPLVNGQLSSNPQAWNDPMGAMFLGSYK